MEKLVSLRNESRTKNLAKSDEINSEDQVKEDSTKEPQDDEDEIFFQISLDMNYHLTRYKANISTMENLREALEQLCQRVHEIKGRKIVQHVSLYMRILLIIISGKEFDISEFVHVFYNLALINFFQIRFIKATEVLEQVCNPNIHNYSNLLLTYIFSKIIALRSTKVGPGTII